MTPIYVMEKMRDWPAVVSALVCPTCSAPEGERCREIHLSFGEPKERPDWHMTRKYAARDAWDAHQDTQQSLQQGLTNPEAATSDQPMEEAVESQPGEAVAASLAPEVVEPQPEGFSGVLSDLGADDAS